MKILFDGQIFIDQVSGGISRYYTNIAAELDKIEGTFARVVSPIYRNEHLRDAPDRKVIGVWVPPTWRAGRMAWACERVFAPLVSLAVQPDIVHETYYAPHAYLTSGRCRVVTIYDMIHELYFPGCLTSQNKRKTLERCDHVICISHHTKKDLCEIFDFPPERASVTHLAYQDFSALRAVEPVAKLAGVPYFLYVGPRGTYKNFATLLKAFAASPLLKKDFRIVCFGGGPLTAEETALAAEAGLAEHHIAVTGGDDARLGSAYAGAAAFVYPSLYEGFGLPPLEAMSAGCPVICSNASSLPEVVGDAALTFAPTDVDALREALERVSQSETLRSDLVVKGHLRRAGFSWARCARETLEVYRSLL